MSQIVEVRYDPPVLPAMTAKSIAAACVIDSQEMYDYAGSQLQLVKTQWAAIEEQRKGMVEPLNTSKARIQAFFNPVLDDLSEAERVYKGAMLTYMREMDRKQREEQAALDEAARKEREHLAAQAKAAEKAGHTEQAQVYEATAAVITAPIATSTYVKPKGFGTTKKWKGRVVDKARAAAAILANPAFIELLLIDESALDRMAAATKGALKLDGIECYEDEIVSSRRAA